MLPMRCRIFPGPLDKQVEISDTCQAIRTGITGRRRNCKNNPFYQLEPITITGVIQMNNLSPKVQNQLSMLQQIQQQLQTVLSQKAQYEMAVREAKRAQEEIADSAEDAVMYMSVGTVMMQKKKEVVNAKLTDCL